MTTITIMPSGKTVEAAEGSTLLQAILSSDARIQHNCDGKVSCGTCHIFVLEGSVRNRALPVRRPCWGPSRSRSKC